MDNNKTIPPNPENIKYLTCLIEFSGIQEH